MSILSITPILTKNKLTGKLLVKIPNQLRIGIDQLWSHLGWTDIICLKYKKFLNNENLNIISIHNKHNWLICDSETELVSEYNFRTRDNVFSNMEEYFQRYRIKGDNVVRSNDSDEDFENNNEDSENNNEDSENDNEDTENVNEDTENDNEDSKNNNEDTENVNEDSENVNKDTQNNNEDTENDNEDTGKKYNTCYTIKAGELKPKDSLLTLKFPLNYGETHLEQPYITDENHALIDGAYCTCDICKGSTEDFLHCYKCNIFDVCSRCYDNGKYNYTYKDYTYTYKDYTYNDNDYTYNDNNNDCKHELTKDFNYENVINSSQLNCGYYIDFCRNNLDGNRILTFTMKEMQHKYICAEKAGKNVWINRTNIANCIYIDLEGEKGFLNHLKYDNHYFLKVKEEYPLNKLRENFEGEFSCFKDEYDIMPFFKHEETLLCDSWYKQEYVRQASMFEGVVTFDCEKDSLVDIITENGYYNAGVGKLILKCKNVF